jgi:hypothetical protein
VKVTAVLRSRSVAGKIPPPWTSRAAGKRRCRGGQSRALGGPGGREQPAGSAGCGCGHRSRSSRPHPAPARWSAPPARAHSYRRPAPRSRGHRGG